MLLAIDTSTMLAGLALYDGAEVVAEAVWRSGRRHTAQLLPQLDLLLHHTGLERAAIDALGVALGPGSWSGLRVGMSLAKALVAASGAALVGISTLEILAWGHPRLAVPVYPLIRLGRERFASARFEHYQALKRCEPDRNVTLDELCAAIDGPALFCGDLDAAAREALGRLMGERAMLPAPAANLRRPANLAELAWQRLAAGESDDPLSLEPVYLGEPVRTG